MGVFHGYKCDECNKRAEWDRFEEQPKLPKGWMRVYIMDQPYVASGPHIPWAMEGTHHFCSLSCATTWLTETPGRLGRKAAAEQEARRAAS